MNKYKSIRNAPDRKTNGLLLITGILLAVIFGFVAHAQSFRERLKPIAENSGFRMEGYWVWGGSAIKVGSEYHLFASRKTTREP